jgi:hypothetical protein
MKARLTGVEVDGTGQSAAWSTVRRCRRLARRRAWRWHVEGTGGRRCRCVERRGGRGPALRGEGRRCGGLGRRCGGLGGAAGTWGGAAGRGRRCAVGRHDGRGAAGGGATSGAARRAGGGAAGRGAAQLGEWRRGGASDGGARAARKRRRRKNATEKKQNRGRRNRLFLNTLFSAVCSCRRNYLLIFGGRLLTAENKNSRRK